MSKRPISRGTAGRYPAGASKSDLSRTASENSISFTRVVIKVACVPWRRVIDTVGRLGSPAPRNSTLMRSGTPLGRTTEPDSKCPLPASQQPEGGRSIYQPSSTDSLKGVFAPGLGSVVVVVTTCLAEYEPILRRSP